MTYLTEVVSGRTPEPARATRGDAAELAELCLKQGGVFTRAQATDHGIDENQLRRHLKDGAIRSIRRGAFALTSLFDPADPAAAHRVEIAAALLLRNHPLTGLQHKPPAPRLAAATRSAALLWGLTAPLPELYRSASKKVFAAGGPQSTSGPEHPARVVELVSADRCRRTYRWGVNVSPSSLPATHLARSGAIPLTTPARTAVDLARELSLPEAVIAADSALRCGTTSADLVRAAEYCRNWSGGRQAMHVVEFADRRAESPAESLARVVFAQQKLPRPDLQVDVHDAAGLVGRVDFLFRRHHTAVEVDGKIKYTDPRADPREVLWREKLREDRLRETGLEVVRVTWAQLVNSPDGVGDRIRRAFARAARLPG